MKREKTSTLKPAGPFKREQNDLAERGCVEDQPQHARMPSVLNLFKALRLVPSTPHSHGPVQQEDGSVN
jgi:hypothetical protein